MEEIKADNLPISTAYELSKLNTEQQQAAFTCFVQTGKLPTSDDVFQSNTLPGDAARLVQQLTCLPDSKLPRLAKLLGTYIHSFLKYSVFIVILAITLSGISLDLALFLSYSKYTIEVNSETNMSELISNFQIIQKESAYPIITVTPK